MRSHVQDGTRKQESQKQESFTGRIHDVRDKGIDLALICENMRAKELEERERASDDAQSWRERQ